jgi:transcriptional regulator with XRE-family HTH domain
MVNTQNPPLGSFIRSRRERLTPEQVGLMRGGRRRAKGLRREELAGLCGVSPTWLTWIEQGRTTSVSAATMSRIATALLLSKAERAYLFEVAAIHDPEKHETVTLPELALTLKDVVTQMRTPAYVLDLAWNAVCWNRAASNLFMGWLSSASPERNLLKYMFLNREARRIVVDWHVRAQRLVAEFRGDCRDVVNDSAILSLIADLRRESKEFESYWSAHNVMEREGGERLFLHPSKGKISMRQVTLRSASSPHMKLVILL